jgi:hypothetical protein
MLCAAAKLADKNGTAQSKRNLADLKRILPDLGDRIVRYKALYRFPQVITCNSASICPALLFNSYDVRLSCEVSGVWPHLAVNEPVDCLCMTRRGALRAMTAFGFGTSVAIDAASKADFWNQRDPSEWSSDDKKELVTNSPWAKYVRADTSRSGEAQPPENGSASSIPRMPGGMEGGGRGMGGRRGGENLPAFYGVVRWESAKPILAALKKDLPKEMEDHYVIGVSGFPLGLHSRQNERVETAGDVETERVRLDELKQVTTLRAKRKDPAQPGVVIRSSDTDGAIVLFGFSRDVITIEPSDKNVEFRTTLGLLDISARFDPKQMAYRGELAV